MEARRWRMMTATRELMKEVYTIVRRFDTSATRSQNVMLGWWCCM